MRGYGVGPNFLCLLTTFWDEAELVCKAGGHFGKRPFKSGRGVTQGGPVSSRTFNLMVDAVVRTWLRLGLGDEASHHGLGELISRLLVEFYADDAIIMSRCPADLQISLDRLVALFEEVGLATNTDKTKAMICVPGKIRTRLLEDVYANSREGLGNRRQWQKDRVECDHCGLELAAGSLRSHLETQHNVFRSLVLNKDLEVKGPSCTYRARAIGPYRDSWDCPYPGCVGTATTKWNLRRHFNDRHPGDKISIPGEGVLPKCGLCGMQTNFSNAPRHEQSEYCQAMTQKRCQHKNAEAAAKAQDESFSAYGVELETVDSFKYLGRLLRYDDNDAMAIRSNLGKARAMWGRLSRVLRAENASPRVCSLFYKATIQAVMLFGSETWNISPASMRSLEGFHLRAARRMAGMMPRKSPNGEWTYPKTEEVLEAAGLHTVQAYIEIRRNTILKFVAQRPIMELCLEAERKRGTGPRQYWWDQPMDLEGARDATATGDFESN